MIVSKGVVDLYKKPEFIFLGPDENTADHMDMAALFIKKKKILILEKFYYWKINFFRGNTS